MTILDELAGYARERGRQAKQRNSEEELERRAFALPRGGFDFEKALGKPGLSFICECKQASPSKGLIAPDFPCLRKDFTVDAYMIYEAKLLGASAVLLICSILGEEEIRDFIALCDRLGLSALVEAHDEGEVETALRAGARMIGVNNRNLKDFSVDTGNSRRLRERIPPGVLFVSESGVKTARDVERLREIGADAVLVGETLMRAADKRAKLAELRGTP